MRRNWSRIWAIGQLRVNIFSHFLQVPSKQRLRASFVRQNFRSIYSIGAAVYSGVGQFLRWMGEVIAGKNRRESGSRASPPSAADNWAPRHAARSPAELVVAIDQLDTEAGSAAWRFGHSKRYHLLSLFHVFFRPEIDLTSIHILFLLFVFLLGRPFQKKLKAPSLHTDQGEIWQEYFQASIDGIGFRICRHTFCSISTIWHRRSQMGAWGA